MSTTLTPSISPLGPKRRLISQLPATNQTADLTAFFGATVDELFQPGTSEPINGYIGHAIAGATDFYVAEPSQSRQFYQLEPGMVSYDATDASQIDFALSYPDFVAYFNTNGGITSDQSRMFETDYYTWAPPINIDMLVNYRQYYWFGDVDLSNQTTYIWNKTDKNGAISLSNSSLTATCQATTNNQPAAIRSTPIASTGLFYVEFTINTIGAGLQYVGIANTIDTINGVTGLQTFGLPGQQSGNNAIILSSNGNIYNDQGTLALASGLDTFNATAGSNVVGMAWSTFSKKVWFRVNGGDWDATIDNPITASGGYDITTLLSNGSPCLVWAGTSNQDQVTINFGSSIFANFPPSDFIGPATVLPTEDLPTLTLDTPYLLYAGDGVTTTFALPESILCVPSYAEQPTAYVNNIVVTDTSLSQDGNSIILPSAPALSTATDQVIVMVCRTPDLASVLTSGFSQAIVSDINTAGVDVLSSGMRINIVDTYHLSDAWDTQPWDHDAVPVGWLSGASDINTSIGWDATNDSIYMVDGVGQSIRLTPLDNMVRGLAAQYVTIDRSSLDGNPWSVRNSWVHQDSFAWSGETFPTRQAARPIIEFIRDIILYGSQTWSENADPLFMLYDLDYNPLNDTTRYPNSTFVGNRIFGYALGSGTTDSVLLRQLVYDNNGYIVFSNDSANVNATYQTGSPPKSTAIVGLTCYATSTTSTNYFPFWRQAANTTIQGYTNLIYNIPVNLQANPDYDEVDQISRSTWVNHFQSLLTNQIGYVGTAAGDTNYRDTARDLSLGTGILQHHCPLLKTMLLTTGEFDVPKAILYAEVEYSRFRNKFVRKLIDQVNRGVLDASADPSLWLSTTLAALKIGHNNSFPFALSGMGGGQYFIPPTPTGLCIQPSAIPAIIVDNTYGTDQDMLLGHDGSVSLLFGDWRDNVLLALETLIYNNLPQPPTTVNNRITPGNGSFLDGNGNIFTISPAGYVIENGTQIDTGGDTSAMQYYDGQVYAQDAASGRWYIFIQEVGVNDGYFQFTATPPPIDPEAGTVFNIQQWIGNRFYTPYQGYSWQEVNSILAPMFELWAQINRVDYRTNNTFDATDPFTWNYRGLTDIAGNSLPGNWRAIYRFYYDTDAPHLRPWEMLGFYSEPTWWSGRYGNAPYALSNSQLWIDLEAGLIASGPRAGTDPRYARPGLLDLVPSDLSGNLRNPIEIGIVLSAVTLDTAQRDWMSGDGGPAETLWQHSPSYRFALARASFLMKPARFVEECWDALGIGYINGQWVQRSTLLRPRNATQYMHAELNPTLSPPAAQPKIGLSQWLSDYLISNGQNSSSLGTAVRGLGVALIHQMAGFTSADTVQLVADSFGLLPAEDVKCILYQSPAVDSEVYSGVIVQWTGHSWSVVGFDGRNPNFTIIPPNVNGPRGIISLASASEPAIVTWQPGTYYPTGILAAYQNSVYQCIRSHTSGSNFETTFWTPRSDLSTAMIRAPRVVTYAQGLNTTISVPYGTEYFTYQDVADFLLGWQRYLVSRGWLFVNQNDNNQILDWSLSVEEFLTWAQVQWAPGNFVALSPGQAELQFNAPQGTILNVEDNVTGFYGLIDRSGAPISQRQAIVSRLDGQITIAANNADIFLARLEICNYEHALVTSNVTIFDDNIYLPLYNLRIQRLRLICNRAYGWAGRLDAPGFIINGNTLASSFEKAATDVSLMFDIELADVQTLRDYARHNVGMQERDYLSNLLLSPSDQFEFYQGMIQEKGTPGVFQALARSTLASGNSTLLFLEEWAFRLSTFGAPRDPLVTFQLIQSEIRGDPQIVRFITQAGAPDDWIEFTSNDTRWYDRPINPSAFFIERNDYMPAVLPTAGPVRLSEVDGTCFDITDVGGLYDPNTFNLPTGTLLWVYNSVPLFEGVNWYVDATLGNDNNSGLSSTSPLQTLQHAHDLCNPGDVVNVAYGVYTAAGLGTNILEITRSGIPSAPITFKASGSQKPLILGSQSTAAVHFNAVAYIIFDGFEIAGWNATLTLSAVQALSASIAAASAIYNGSGIVIDRGISAKLPHHITIQNCLVHDFPYNGILANWTDYITIQNCTVYSNGLYSVYSGSGINILNSHATDNISTYKFYITQNVCYGNINLVLNATSGNLTDGCGITIAGNLNDYTDGVAYSGRTLVQNNLVYNNGGVGIKVNDSQHVDVTFNTAYKNQTNTNYAFGEIAAYASIDVNIANNIMVALANVPLATSSSNTDTFYINTIGYGGVSSVLPGIGSITDPLFVNPPYDFSLRQGSWALKSASPQFLTEVDLNGDIRNDLTGYDIGCYQRESQKLPITGQHPYTVLRSFDVGGTTPNQILAVTTSNEDPTVTTSRVSFQQTMTIYSDDIGNYLVIDGATNSSPDLQGIQTITAVYPATNSVDLLAVGTLGNSFLNSLTTAPEVRILRPVRFSSISTINPNISFNVGDLVWIDAYTPDQWAVLQWNGAGWQLYRLQPHRIDPTAIAETVVYSAGASIQDQQMILNQPVIDDVVVIDPLAGLICNLSDRDIDYKTDFDPARYNAGQGTQDANLWGDNEIGRIWWDLSTVRFLDTFTDTMGITPARDLAELQYRLAYWGNVAPNSSVDIWEWTESLEDPITYALDPTNTGTVYQGGASWVVRTVYDPSQKQDVVKYYFWVSGSALVPNVPFRNISASEIALGIQNPAAVNVAWMSAISQDALLVSGVSASLDETTTVMKVRLAPVDSVGHHDQWLLMRPGDETSLPPDMIWGKVRDGLAGFQVTTDGLLTIPDPSLTLSRSIGIDDGQSMFTVSAANIAQWQPGVTYYYGDQVANLGLAFQCVIEGVSAGLPYLVLSNEDTATYSSQPSANTLVFTYNGLYSAGIGPIALQMNTANITYIAVTSSGASITPVLLSQATITSSNPFATVLQFTLTFPFNVTLTVGQGPTGYSDTISDGTVVWAYHGTDSSRAGLLDARAAFVGSVNAILAQTALKIDRASLLQSIYRTTGYPSDDFITANTQKIAYLVWAQMDASYPYEPPPANEWDQSYEVFTLTQRNDLLATQGFLDAVSNNTPIDVLLSGFANSVPQWSIWRFNTAIAASIILAHHNLPAATALQENADVVFTLKTAYEYSVANEAARNTLATSGTLNHLDRVLVINDTDNFWAIYQWYEPTGVGGYFNLWRVQTYNTADFIEDADWYDTATLTANGYDPTDPPIITYNTVADRNAAEGSSPTNLLVTVLNLDLPIEDQNFIWTLFINGVWQTVAIGNATVQLSANFYDPLRPVHAVSTATSPSAVTLSDVGQRDGSWELYILTHALRYSGLLLESEINTLWFAVVNFVHVQQNEVDWAFKTSFMTLAGIAAPMTQTPIQTLDQTGDVTDYINEVKPYRVKLRETTTQYVPDIDTANFRVTDFDDPVYTDPTTGIQRPLDPTNATDITILQGDTDPYSDWYQNYNLPNPPTRSFTVTILFDRVVGTTNNWDMLAWDSADWDDCEADPGAGYRILTYYEPTTGMAPLDLTALLNLNEKENQISSPMAQPPAPSLEDDGSTFSPTPTIAVGINPAQPSQPGGYDLRPPYYAAEHPEERIVLTSDDNILLHVTAQPLAGGCPQIVKVFDLNQSTLSGLTTTLFMDMLPHSMNAVMVFCDGLRAVLGTDYTVDYLNRSVILNRTVNGNAVGRAVIHVFSFGGTSAVTEQHFLTYGTNALTLNNPTSASNVLAVVNGTPVATSGISVSGTTVTLLSPPSNGSDVALAVYANGITTACMMNVQQFGYTASQIYTLAVPDTQTVPPHAGTIVELNGQRLTPPITYYGSMTVGSAFMYLPLMPDVTTTVTVWVNNVLYTAAIPIATSTSTSSTYPFGLVLPGAAPSTAISGQFCLYNNMLIALDPNFASSNIKVSMIFATSPPDYTVSTNGQTLTINTALSSNAVITVTTFSNASCMDIRTSSYQVGSTVQPIVPTPWNKNYCLAWMGGNALVQEDDYVIVSQQFSSGGAYFTSDVIQLINPEGSGYVVVTAFAGQPAREIMEWLYCSTTSAANRMYPALTPVEQPAGWDAIAYDSQQYDNAQLMGLPTNGLQNLSALYSIDRSFEHVRLSPYMAGTLAADLGVSDSTLTINLFVNAITTKMQDQNPLPIPDTARDRPGVIYIEGERIEYFSYSRTNNVVTLGALRRATRGTSMGAKRLTQSAYATGSAQTFTFAASGTVDVEIDDVGIASSDFTVSGTTSVTLTAEAGTFIVVGLTIAASHQAGTTVYNGREIFMQDLPLGPAVGDREQQPMHRIITGG
jgi:hypothetical protein